MWVLVKMLLDLNENSGIRTHILLNDTEEFYH